MVVSNDNSHLPYMSVEEELAIWASLHDDLKVALGCDLEIDSPIYELLVSDSTTLGWIKSGFLRTQTLLSYPEIFWLNLLHPIFQNAIASRHFTLKQVLSFESEWIKDKRYYEALCQPHVQALVLAHIYQPDRFLTLSSFRLRALMKSRELCRRLLGRRLLVPRFHRIAPTKMEVFLDSLIEPTIM